MIGLKLKHINKWGSRYLEHHTQMRPSWICFHLRTCQKQVSSAWISNYIPRYSKGFHYLSMHSNTRFWCQSTHMHLIITFTTALGLSVSTCMVSCLSGSKDTATSLLANGNTAFTWKLCCLWLNDWWWPHVASGSSMWILPNIKRAFKVIKYNAKLKCRFSAFDYEPRIHSKSSNNQVIK